jgi:hypothetical protein
MLNEFLMGDARKYRFPGLGIVHQLKVGNRNASEGVKELVC